MNTWKQNLEETKKRYIDWWNHKGIILNMWEHFQQGVTPHADIPLPPAPKSLDQKWFDPEWRAEYLDWYVAHSCLKADILPVANTQLGPGSLAAILGGVFEGGKDTIWIHPNPDFTDDIQFDLEHPNWLLHKALLRACKEKAKGHYYVGMPDLMEGMDVLAAIKGTDKVLLDTVMQPDVLERQMQLINDIYFKVFDELYDIIREGDEMAFCYFSAWAPGKMSKLQSDISTMISVEDYRRFVQPFIREQCQKIDYTLYHLDGVGALRHLPALLEIEELNAIQWTPGVGEPQGGSPKWYNLYKKILDGGKSVMACWVTLDELKPLLDNIGGDGVHLEMDFHNEDEVEKAMRIVEEYQSKSSANKDDQNDVIRIKGDISRPPLSSISKEKILILDGAMGTMIQSYNLTENDFRGVRFVEHPNNLKGFNDILCLTRPDVIQGIHRKYLEAGADIIETNTFNSQRISMADYGVESLCHEINIEACRLAREVADEYTAKNPDKPRYVVGSVGPTAKTCSIIDEKTQNEGQPFSYELLASAYEEQIGALLDGGVDAILIETIFDTLNAKAAIEAARSTMRRMHRNVPLMLSFTIATAEGYNMLGQSIIDFISSVGGSDILSVGINCCSDVNMVTPFIEKLGAAMPYGISIYPNAGLPDASGHYSHTPEMLRNDLWHLAERHLLNIIGGCCGTTDGHICKLAEMVEPIEGLRLSPHIPQQFAENISEKISTSQNVEKPDLILENTDKKETSGSTLFNAIIDGDSEKAVKGTRKAIEDGIAPQDIINLQMIGAMAEIGQRFEDGKAFVPQLLMAGRAMKAGLELLKPLLAGDTSTTIGRVVIGTVKGDLHDIGKNLVASMLEGCGFDVVNVGIDVSCDKFVEAVKQNNADILCLSALLTTTMTYMKDVIAALEKAGIRDKVKVMIGGAPVTQDFADEIGADGYSDNANSAVILAKELLGKG